MNTSTQTSSVKVNSPQISLDKSFTSPVSESYGTIDIRVVVLQKRVQQTLPDVEPPADAMEGEIFTADTSKSVLSGYLEDPKRGKECIVFLVNGQRQEAWDNTFIQRELGFKYLRNRTIIIVTLDGLQPEALADIMQGSREHFYPGTVYGAIVGRLTATLRKDPDLERLEAEAERQISELRTGDEAVKNALDQLIESHHAYGDHTVGGATQTGPDGGTAGFTVDRPQDVIVPPSATAGSATTGPYLISDHVSQKIRLVPNEAVSIHVGIAPNGASPKMTDVDVAVLPLTPGLTVQQNRRADKLELKLGFSESEDFDEDMYPIDATLRITARLEGLPEPRLLQKKIVIAPRIPPEPRPVPILREKPSFLKVTSRQPVRLVRGAADTHVRLKWDGQDSLATGRSPAWSFGALCKTEPTLGPITFSRPRSGRFELLVPTPATLVADTVLDFEIEAKGPDGDRLTATFSGVVVEPPPAPPPRKIKGKVPAESAVRRPPYELHYINQEKFDEVPIWQDDRSWTVNDAGCFVEPTASKPLVLVINEDFAALQSFREAVTGGSKKLDPATIERRVTRYTSHVAFHLYQMYENYRAKEAAIKRGENAHEPTPDEMNGEINRVATTLTKMMEVGT
jgi:hypothetical protein